MEMVLMVCQMQMLVDVVFYLPFLSSYELDLG
jgi:hypothetical protein